MRLISAACWAKNCPDARQSFANFSIAYRQTMIVYLLPSTLRGHRSPVQAKHGKSQRHEGKKDPENNSIRGDN